VGAEDFDAFAARELPWLLRYAVMLTGDRELARDLVQDVMLKAHSRWERVSAADRPRLYVRTMITHAFLSWRRRWSVRNVLLGSIELTDGPPVADHSAAIVERSELWQLLATLPRQQRAVLVLRYYEGLTDAEIAAVLNCSEGTVRGYHSRALATLRGRLAPLSDLAQEPR
jgi:RNA polymerase sigma-70 factor (sigma-E family)